MMTNPSASNPLHPNTNQNDFHLPQSAMHGRGASAAHNRTPSSTFHLGTPQKKPGRSTSVGMPTSIPTYFDNNNSAAVSSAGNSITGGPSTHNFASSGMGIAPAPTSIPPDLAAMQQPPIPVSTSMDSEPKLFPGIFSKSRQGSITSPTATYARLNNAESTRRVSNEGGSGDHDDKLMTASLTGLGRVKSEGGASTAITEESEVGSDFASDEGEGN